jgi:hypothetical protein
VLHEFSEAWGIYRSDVERRSREAASVHRSPALIGVDEFQPVIPWRVALQQRPPPLHRPRSECDKVILPVENFAANGELSFGAFEN